MKTLSAGLEAHYAQEVTTLAYLWKITREDGQIFGFTSHDLPVVYDGVTYEASSGFMPSAVSTSGGLAVDDVELEGMLVSDAITEADLTAGLWDRAEVWLYQVNYNDLTMGANVLRRGWLGETTMGTNRFTVELRGMNQRLAQAVGDNFSPVCRATFGSPKCGKDLNSYKVTGTITAVPSNRVFVDAARTEADGYFDLGYVTFTSGNNTGVSREIKTYAADTITCEFAFPFLVEVGDAYEMFKGCDKKLATCRDTYNNVVNFRGEPYIPTADSLVQGPNK